MTHTTTKSEQIEAIKNEMTKMGLSFVGIYSKTPETIYYAIDTVKSFGWEYWLQRTTAGNAVKDIVFRLSESK